jgi:hypothetical protein
MSMMPSCIDNPSNEPILVLRQWQVEFCEGNHCAAAILSFLIYFDDLKKELQYKNRKSNDIAELHGDGRTQDESLLQFHTNEDLSSRILNIYGKNAIVEGLKFLQNRGAITVHRNPNPKYKFDKTNYFLLHPDVCNQWLTLRLKNTANSNGYKNEITNYPKNSDQSCEIKPTTIENDRHDCLISDNREFKNSQLSPENKRTITKTSFQEPNELINKDFEKSFTAEEEKTDHTPVAKTKTISPEAADVIASFEHLGMPRDKLTRDFDLEAVEQALQTGLKSSDLVTAYHKALQTKGNEKFSLHYVLKIAANLPLKSAKTELIVEQKEQKCVVENEAELKLMYKTYRHDQLVKELDYLSQAEKTNILNRFVVTLSEVLIGVYRKYGFVAPLIKEDFYQFAISKKLGILNNLMSFQEFSQKNQERGTAC